MIDVAKAVRLYTSYPVTPTLSVDAAQLSVMLDIVCAVDARFVGAVGACVSPPG
ncbi:hypothetical protein D3C74_507400 [compost metagenome]